jgi:hypothetical protein
MARLIILYALALALAVTGLEWLEYRYVTRAFSTEIYIVAARGKLRRPRALGGTSPDPTPDGRAGIRAQRRRDPLARPDTPRV